MRSSIGVLALAVVLILPRMSDASELEISVLFPSLFFGPAGASFEGGTFDDIFIDGVFQETPWLSAFSGEVEFESASMLSLTVDDSDPDRVSSFYEFGSGTFTLTAHWTDQFGDPAEGKYVAPLLGLEVFIRCEQELSALDCGDVFHGSLGDMFASFGPGLFDDLLARALGLRRSGGAFSFQFDIDGVSGNPFDPTGRAGGLQRGEEEIAIPVEVPEPAVISLLVLAPIVALRFRRTRNL